MRRSLTGSSLAFLLIVVITMQQVVLGFCACDQSYFADACHCEKSTAHEHSGAHACASDSCSEETPCDDCNSNVSLDPGDFQWTPLDEPVAQFTVDLVALPHAPLALLPASAQPTILLSPARGSPPGDVPLFLRDSVLRL